MGAGAVVVQVNVKANRFTDNYTDTEIRRCTHHSVCWACFKALRNRARASKAAATWSLPVAPIVTGDEAWLTLAGMDDARGKLLLLAADDGGVGEAAGGAVALRGKSVRLLHIDKSNVGCG